MNPVRKPDQTCHKSIAVRRVSASDHAYPAIVLRCLKVSSLDKVPAAVFLADPTHGHKRCALQMYVRTLSRILARRRRGFDDFDLELYR